MEEPPNSRLQPMVGLAMLARPRLKRTIASKNAPTPHCRHAIMALRSSSASGPVWQPTVARTHQIEHVEGQAMNRQVAEQAIAALFDAAARINDTLLMIQKDCTEEEFAAYRTGTGLAMGYLYAEVIDPILREHPDLTPEEIK